MRQAYRSLWLSDIHLGTAACRAAELLAFLDGVEAETVYLTGDIVDLERLNARPNLPAVHREVIARFIALAQGGTRVLYIPGNHDVELRRLAGGRVGDIQVALEAVHTCLDGTRLLVIHGDCLEARVRRDDYAEQVGRAAYQWLVDADALVNRLRMRFGADHASFSARLKARLGPARDYIRRFEEAAAHHAALRGFDGIICGHIHRPCIRRIGNTLYANDGDWVEHASAVVETQDGRMNVLSWAGGSLVARPALEPVAA